MTLRPTWRSRLRPMTDRALPNASLFTSSSMTGRPASAHTCARPRPIWPAPTTPTLAAARDNDARGGQFRPLAARKFGRDKARDRGHAEGGDRLHGGAATLGGHRIKTRGAHGDHFPGVAASDGGQRVAGVDRPDEGVG